MIQGTTRTWPYELKLARGRHMQSRGFLALKIIISDARKHVTTKAQTRLQQRVKQGVERSTGRMG